MSLQSKSAVSLSNRPYLILTVTAAMWGANTLFSRLAVGEVSPMLVTFLRWGISCILIWGVTGPQVVQSWPKLKPHILRVVLMSIFGFTGFNALFYTAAYHTTAVNISIIQGSQPILVLIGAAILFGIAIHWQQTVGIILTMVGIAAIALKGEIQTLLTLSFNIGDVWMLIASIFYAGYTLALRGRPNVPGLVFFTILTTVAAISSLPLVAYEIMSGTVVWPTLQGWIVTLAIAVFPSFLAQIFFIRGVELIGPARAGVFINLIPVFGTAFAIVFLREPFTTLHAAGLALVLIGIWFAERR